jgi:hypothetical protein
MVFTPDNTIIDVLNVNVLVGTSGSDQILGLEGDDLIFGAEADDQLFGNEGADSVYGHQENDIIYGGSGADFLFGGQGDDSIYGDEGNDILYADRGTDILIGGEGEDIFVFDIGSGNFSVTTTNLIVDFNVDEDQIEIQDNLTFEDLSIEGTPTGDTVIRETNSGEIFALLQGVNPDSVTEEQIITSGVNPPPPSNPSGVTVSLANDTGLDDRDNITTDPTITGTVTNSDQVAELEVSIGGEFISIETEIAEDGSFTLTQEQLEETLNISFTDGIYTVQLRTVDTEGLRSLETAELTFTIAPDDDPPEQDIELVPPGTDMFAPTITAELANDTGTNESDGITSDPTITGTATDNFGIEEIEVRIGEEFVPIQTSIAADGSFTLTPDQLEEALETSLTDGTYTVFLRAVDTAGLRSLELAEVTFTLDSTPGSGGETPGSGGETPGSGGETPGSGGETPGSGGETPGSGGETPNNEEISIPENVEDTPTNTIVNNEEFPDPFETETVDLEEDPGNTIEDAYEISVNTQTFIYTDEVSEDDPVDYYTFNVVSNQNLNLSLESLTQDVDVFLLDINQEIIATSENLGITAESITVPLSAGTYYVQVQSFDNQTTIYDLNILFPSRSPEDDTTEVIEVPEDPGNTVTEAYDISIDTETTIYTEQVSADDPIDYYTFNVENNQNFNVFLENITQDVNISVLDIDQTVVATSENVGTTNESINVPLSAGTYYIQVESVNNQTTTYDLNVLFPPAPSEDEVPEVIEVPEDPGNTVIEAYDISIDSSVTNIYTEQVGAVDSVDYYEINIENNQNLNVFLENISQDVNISVLDIDQTVVATSQNVGTTNESINVPLSAGTYYIQVETISTQTTTYNLNVFLPPAPPEPEPLVRYDFVYYSNGISTQSDYYTGYVYAEAGAFAVGESYEFSSSSSGAYYIASETSAPTTASVDQVFINNYYDVDININSAVSYSSYYSNINQASGSFGLGSEYDFVQFEGIFFGFGLQVITTNIVLPFFINPNFPQRDDYFVGDRPSGITSADLDGDGDNDLIVENSGLDPRVLNGFDDNRLSLLENNGDGTFADFVTLTTGVGPTAIAADLDNDGDTDIATAHFEDNDIAIFLNSGGGSFEQPEFFEAGERPNMREVADIDGDGDLDLLTVNTETFALGTVIDEGDSISIHFNDGEGNFNQREVVTVGEGVYNVTTADLDNDGNLDLITANEGENTLSVLFNTGNASFSTPEKYAVGDRPRSPIAADLDNDGDLDLAVANFEGSRSSDIFDFEQGTISILRNDGNGNFSPSVSLLTGDFPRSLTSADIDGDGDLDLMTPNAVFTLGTGEREGNVISLLRNNGNGFFSFPESFLVGNIPTGLVVDDLDGEGNLDFATPNFDDDDVTVYLQS